MRIVLITTLLFAMLIFKTQPTHAQCEGAVTELPIVLVEPDSLTTTYRITNLEASTASVTQEIYIDGLSYGQIVPAVNIAANGSMDFDLQDYVNNINPPIPADADDIKLVVSSDLCVTLSILPNARFTPSTLIGFAPFDVQFNTESLFVNEWTWDFGDGNTSTEESPVHLYAAAGNYTVTLTISGDHGTALLPEASPIVITVLDEKSRVYLPFINTN